MEALYPYLYFAPFVGLFILWVLVNMKTSRPDGDLVKNLHPYRRMMFYTMITRNESVVYFDEYINAEPLLAYLEKANQKFECNLTHAIVAGTAVGFAENPEMNRFVSGYRLYQRKGIHLAFSMKRKKLDKKAKIAVVKQEITPRMTFQDFCEVVNSKINVERSGKKTYADKEFNLFTKLPRPVFHRAFGLFRQLNYWNLLPNSFIANDPMHVSMFTANLGSLNMGAGFHHLYEWGTCPLFMMVGKIEDRPTVVDGEVIVQKTMHVRFSYDERIDDGLTAGQGIQTFKEVMENPEFGLGCLGEHDRYPLTMHRVDRH